MPRRVDLCVVFVRGGDNSMPMTRKTVWNA